MFVCFSGEGRENEETFDTNEPDLEDEDSIVGNLTVLCVVGIEDPVRDEVSCSNQGRWTFTAALTLDK